MKYLKKKKFFYTKKIDFRPIVVMTAI